MSEHLSGEEKRRRLKEQYKKELRERKDFLEKAKRLRTLKNINQAIDNISYEDDTDEWVNRLNQETAFNDAKMEMLVESNVVNETELNVKDEEELQKLSAKQLVEDMKRELGIEIEEETDEAPIAEAEEEVDAKDQGDSGAKKTLGDF